MWSSKLIDLLSQGHLHRTLMLMLLLSLDGVMVALLNTRSNRVPYQVHLSYGTLHFHHHFSHCTHATNVASISHFPIIYAYAFTTLLYGLLRSSLTTTAAIATPLRITA